MKNDSNYLINEYAKIIKKEMNETHLKQIINIESKLVNPLRINKDLLGRKRPAITF
ncbi:hypothetical protein LEP1GSC050_4147 [Leptospira broomii serovar Hurstbridge str. 5399]|uniref:Uncharacterized protein n=1 Tax=Leptospira broomii serovar Hurstbridge str. 5399 TaxID=1049789 RepID=T0FC58_9LEPT|nr:hypothetical protein LEP1GSC050_4147 [Leptospira broomii serovar Hurstbridge str. 5399]